MRRNKRRGKEEIRGAELEIIKYFVIMNVRC